MLNTGESSAYETSPETELPGLEQAQAHLVFLSTGHSARTSLIRPACQRCRGGCSQSTAMSCASDTGQTSDTHFVAHSCSAQGSRSRDALLKSRARGEWHPVMSHAPAQLPSCCSNARLLSCSVAPRGGSNFQSKLPVSLSSTPDIWHLQQMHSDVINVKCQMVAGCPSREEFHRQPDRS